MNPPDRVPRVFISYSHDSPEHADRVLALAHRLRAEGIDCHLDQYETSPPEGWPRWMLNQVEASDFVLVVCTETYNLRFRGKAGEVGKGLGVKWEGAIVTQELYDAEANNTRFVPVVFSAPDKVHIPIPLRSATHYDLGEEAGYESFYRHLTNQPLTPPPDLGPRRPMPPRQRKQNFFSGWNPASASGDTEPAAENLQPVPSLATRASRRKTALAGICVLVLISAAGYVLFSKPRVVPEHPVPDKGSSENQILGFRVTKDVENVLDVEIVFYYGGAAGADNIFVCAIPVHPDGITVQDGRFGCANVDLVKHKAIADLEIDLTPRNVLGDPMPVIIAGSYDETSAIRIILKHSTIGTFYHQDFPYPKRWPRPLIVPSSPFLNPSPNPSRR
jgi:hypothetical protein